MQNFLFHKQMPTSCQIKFLLVIYGILFLGALLPGIAILEARQVFDVPLIVANDSILLQRQLIFRLLVLLGALVTLRPICVVAMHITAWMNVPERRNGRLQTIIILLTLLFIASLQGHGLIFNKGVPGWTYQSLVAPLVPNEPTGIKFSDFPEVLREQAIIESRLIYIKHNGYLSGNILLLHFVDGSIRPGSLAMTRNTWPLMLFEPKDGKFAHEAALGRMIRHTLDIARTGRSFIIPEALSYPKHINFNAIDYREYPPSDRLQKISYWKVTAKIDEKADIAKILGAERLAEMTL